MSASRTSSRPSPQTDTHRGKITFDDLLKAVLRHRPDRIVVGEVRGVEARTLLDVVNTGHRGALATIHASGPKQAASRLAGLAARAGGGMTVRSLEDEVLLCLDLIVHLSRRNGLRSVESIFRCRSHRPKVHLQEEDRAARG